MKIKLHLIISSSLLLVSCSNNDNLTVCSRKLAVSCPVPIITNVNNWRAFSYCKWIENPPYLSTLVKKRQSGSCVFIAKGQECARFADLPGTNNHAQEALFTSCMMKNGYNWRSYFY